VATSGNGDFQRSENFILFLLKINVACQLNVFSHNNEFVQQSFLDLNIFSNYLKVAF
jgi:16S rRNA G527 N7-methylase RsmG